MGPLLLRRLGLRRLFAPAGWPGRMIPSSCAIVAGCGGGALVKGPGALLVCTKAVGAREGPTLSALWHFISVVCGHLPLFRGHRRAADEASALPGELLALAVRPNPAVRSWRVPCVQACGCICAFIHHFAAGLSMLAMVGRRVQSLCVFAVGIHCTAWACNGRCGRNSSNQPCFLPTSPVAACRFFIGCMLSAGCRLAKGHGPLRIAECALASALRCFPVRPCALAGQSLLRCAGCLLGSTRGTSQIARAV